MAKLKIPNDIYIDLNPAPVNVTIARHLAYIKACFKADNDDFHRIRERRAGFINHDEVNFKNNTDSVAQYFIPTLTLTNLLFNSEFTGENQISGFRIWFKENSDNILLSRVAESQDETDRLILRELPCEKIEIKPINAKTRAGGLLNPKKFLTQLSIKAYFVGRLKIMGHLLDSDGNLISNNTGIELAVRKHKKGACSIMFYVVQNSKSKTYIGTASFTNDDINGIVTPLGVPTTSRITPAGGMAGSRPSPPYNPE